MNKSFRTYDYLQTELLGQAIGAHLKGSETFELISDLGGGKTTFVSGLAKGFGSPDPVSSPSFTINYVYSRPDKKQLYHFDFYRLSEAGIIANELSEVEGSEDTVVVVEWGEIVHKLLPDFRIKVTIKAVSENQRIFTFEYKKLHSYLFTNIKKFEEV